MFNPFIIDEIINFAATYVHVQWAYIMYIFTCICT